LDEHTKKLDNISQDLDQQFEQYTVSCRLQQVLPFAANAAGTQSLGRSEDDVVDEDQ
jgi:hypothetical protein